MAAAVVAKSLQSCPTLCNPTDGKPTRLLCPLDSPVKKTGVGCHFLLQCMKGKVKGKSLSRIRFFPTPWTAAYQTPLSMGFSWQEYCSGLPLPPPKRWLKINKIVDLNIYRYISARTGSLVHTSIPSNGIHHLNIHTELPHPFDHTASLQSKFISRSQAEALAER